MREHRMFLYNDRAKSEMAKRVDAMFARVTNQTKVWDELHSRMTDPDALYFCGFEMAPDFVKMGDQVVTKYGDEGRVTDVFHQDEKIEIKTENGQTVNIGSDRISSLSYGNLDLVDEPSLDDETFGWGY